MPRRRHASLPLSCLFMTSHLRTHQADLHSTAPLQVPPGCAGWPQFPFLANFCVCLCVGGSLPFGWGFVLQFDMHVSGGLCALLLTQHGQRDDGCVGGWGWKSGVRRSGNVQGVLSVSRRDSRGSNRSQCGVEQGQSLGSPPTLWPHLP